jgi:diamine N-acetyltransferase
MSDLSIEKVQLQDAARLQAISLRTFVDTFAALNTPENMAKYVSERLSLAQMQAELANPDSEFYFAIQDGSPIGYLKLNRGTAQTEPQGDDAAEIERIYVVQEYLGKGVAQELFAFALQRAKQVDARVLWLAVWEENPRAIRFYEKCGFVEFGRHTFILGDDAQTDLMLRMDLQ